MFSLKVFMEIMERSSFAPRSEISTISWFWRNDANEWNRIDPFARSCFRYRTISKFVSTFWRYQERERLINTCWFCLLRKNAINEFKMNIRIYDFHDRTNFNEYFKHTRGKKRIKKDGTQIPLPQKTIPQIFANITTRKKNRSRFTLNSRDRSIPLEQLSSGGNFGRRGAANLIPPD